MKVHKQPFFSVLVFVMVLVLFPDFEWLSSLAESALILLLTLSALFVLENA